MAIAVEDELSATGPLKLDILKNCRLIFIIERVLRINEEGEPLFLLDMLIPQEAHHIDASLDT